MILALDSSTLTLSLALVDRVGAGARAVEAVTFGPPRKQSELLPGVIGELLARHQLALSALEGIVVGLGPGSFTGLRLGLATAKALAYAAKLPLAGASSLAALALAMPPEESPRVVAASAVVRQGELYLGLYRRDAAGVEALEPETAVTPAELAELLRAHPGHVALGPSIAPYRAQLLALGAPEAQLRDEPSYPLAVHLAQLATLVAFDPAALFALEPHYVRGSGAERNPKFPPLPGPEPTARLRED